jgi:hypothetical protein
VVTLNNEAAIAINKRIRAVSPKDGMTVGECEKFGKGQEPEEKHYFIRFTKYAEDEVCQCGQYSVDALHEAGVWIGETDGQ